MFTNDEIKTTLYMLLKDRGWSVNKLAHKSNLPQSTINSMLHGNKEYYPSIPTLHKICESFGITISSSTTLSGFRSESKKSDLINFS